VKAEMLKRREWGVGKFLRERLHYTCEVSNNDNRELGTFSFTSELRQMDQGLIFLIWQRCIRIFDL
jgi:hypothetical protein